MSGQRDIFTVGGSADERSVASAGAGSATPSMFNDLLKGGSPSDIPYSSWKSLLDKTFGFRDKLWRSYRFLLVMPGNTYFRQRHSELEKGLRQIIKQMESDANHFYNALNYNDEQVMDELKKIYTSQIENLNSRIEYQYPLDLVNITLPNGNVPVSDSKAVHLTKTAKAPRKGRK